MRIARRIIKPLAACAVIALLVSMANLGQSAELSAVKAWLTGQGMLGWPLLFTAGVLLMVLGFPRQVVAFLGGGLLGATAGTVIATLMSACACAVTFMLSRYFLHSWVRRRYPTVIAKLHPLLSKKPYSATLMIRLLPIGSNALINIVAGASTIRGHAFVSASAVGYIPQMLTFALLGQGVEEMSSLQITVSLILLACALLLGAHLYRWDQKQEITGVADLPAEKNN